MTNTQLRKIRERLIEENDKRRRNEFETANARAGAYARGVEDTLVAIAACADEQDGEEEKLRTNLDRIRAMSAEELAIWINSRNIDCDECPAAKMCRAFNGDCARVFEMWLNSPAKEDDNA